MYAEKASEGVGRQGEGVQVSTIYKEAETKNDNPTTMGTFITKLAALESQSTVNDSTDVEDHKYDRPNEGKGVDQRGIREEYIFPISTAIGNELNKPSEIPDEKGRNEALEIKRVRIHHINPYE